MPVNKLVIVLGALLFVSLAGNFFMGGVLIGKTMSGQERYDRKEEWEKRDRMLKARLSEDDRNILKGKMEAKREKFRELKGSLDDARAQVEAAMEAKPFDQAALDEALRREKEAKMTLLNSMREAKQEAMEGLSPEGRKTLEEMGREREGRFRNWRQDRRYAK